MNQYLINQLTVDQNDIYAIPAIARLNTEKDKQMAWDSIAVSAPKNSEGLIVGYPEDYTAYKPIYIAYEKWLGCRHQYNNLGQFMFHAGVPI